MERFLEPSLNNKNNGNVSYGCKTKVSIPSHVHQKNSFLTRMHSSNMCTTRSLTICHTCPMPATHAAPAMHAPPPRHTQSPAMYAPPHPSPCHACPLPHTPPTTHAPPTTHPSSHHAHTLHHPCPSCGQNSWHALLKILPCPNFVAGGNN